MTGIFSVRLLSTCRWSFSGGTSTAKGR